jgi:hypothetical protein
MTKTTAGFKAFTHDLRPPVQGGEPIWDGTLPYLLPKVRVDRSAKECAAGWNFAREAHVALRIAGLWPDGRPSRLFAVEAAGEVVERGEKLRTASLTITHELGLGEIKEAVAAFSAVFAPHVEWMSIEQLEWRAALGRPVRDPAAVEAGLREALDARDLQWTLRRFDSPRDAWAAWAAWDARDARDARDAWAAWDAWDAWAALTLAFAARQGWVKSDAMLLTRGLREAYRNGLEMALPTAPNELGLVLAR